MASKQGRVQFKDICQGKTFWRVNIYTHANGERRADKPFRMFINSLPRFGVYRLSTTPAKPEWYFFGRCDHDHSLLRRPHDMTLDAFAIGKDGLNPIDPVEGLLLFKSKRAVEKFIKVFLATKPTVAEHLEAIDLDVRNKSFECDQDRDAEEERMPSPLLEEEPEHANDNSYMLAP